MSSLHITQLFIFTPTILLNYFCCVQKPLQEEEQKYCHTLGINTRWECSPACNYPCVNHHDLILILRYLVYYFSLGSVSVLKKKGVHLVCEVIIYLLVPLYCSQSMYCVALSFTIFRGQG